MAALKKMLLRMLWTIMTDNQRRSYVWARMR